MIKINFYLVGKVKEPYLKEAFSIYKERISHYANVSINFIEESPLPLVYKEAEVNKALLEEGKRIIKAVKSTDYKILLDLHGKSLDSVAFANKLNDIALKGYSSLSFIIGSSYGISDEVRAFVDFRLKLSEMTFTHPQTLLLILEQVYRAVKINSNETYHK